MLQPSVLEDFPVDSHDGIWIVHLAGLGRREHVGAVQMLVVFLNQQVHGFLRNGNLADRGIGFRPGNGDVPVSVAGDVDNGILAP